MMILYWLRKIYNASSGLGTESTLSDIKVDLRALSDIKIATDAIKIATETIDNFISGSRGLVTEDNSGDIKTAIELLDNFISGSRGLVTEDNSGDIKTAVEAIQTSIDDSLANYQISDVDADASPYYYGFVDKSENWYILKQTGDSEATFRYCKGTGSYATAWTNRETHDYNYFFTEF